MLFCWFVVVIVVVVGGGDFIFSKAKAKLKLPMYLLTKHYAMKKYRGSGNIALTALISALDVSSKLHASAALATGRGAWVDPRADLDAVENNLAPDGNQTPDIHLVACLYTD
jgi:hypothetical protein